MKSKIYLKINHPERNSAVQKDSKLKSKIVDILIRLLKFVIPEANPDFENLYEKVKYWKIEFDTIEDFTSREIGFNENGYSIVAAPYRNNYGFWTDNNLKLKDYDNFEPISISEEEFNSDWQEFEDKRN